LGWEWLLKSVVFTGFLMVCIFFFFFFFTIA
jgi:hypothetical protein